MGTSLTTGGAILRAILEEPGEDLHRLAYADWLDEYGGDHLRAEFIRVQCEIARLLASPASPVADFRLLALACRELQLLGENVSDGPGVLPRWEVWCAEAGVRPEWVRVRGYGVGADDVRGSHFRRGFVDEVALPCADFLEHAGSLFAAQPVAKVTLTDRAPLPAYSSVGVGAPITGWGWGPESDDYANAGVPAPLYPLLTGFWPRERAWKVYPGQPDALAALSAACVSHGRDEARKRRR